MTSIRNPEIAGSRLRGLARAVLFSLLAGAANASPNIALYDTVARGTDQGTALDRTAWKPVPTDLFTLEADPAKAASDPGYYGRPYTFRGDTVVENAYYTVIFQSDKGRMVIHLRERGESNSQASALLPGKHSGRAVAEIAPLPERGQTAVIKRCDIVRHAGDEVVVEALFAGIGPVDIPVVFAFGKTEIIEIKPAPKLKGVRIVSPIAYGVAPSVIGDDLIVRPAEHAAASTLAIPSDHLFLGLLQGEGSELVLTWPGVQQRLSVNLGGEAEGKHRIESIDFENHGQGLYLAALAAPGIWHREALVPSQLEKDVTIGWQRPFPAKWTTQLDEAGVRTTFTFREAKAQIWRGVPGSYNYPVWFNGDKAVYHLSKKVPPKGESLIYFLEGGGTPLSVSTPVDILKSTLGRPLSDSLLDVTGRRLRSHHRRSDAPVHRACTCGFTEAIQAVFEQGQEVSRNEFVCNSVDDMIYFVQQHVQRIDEYRRFADEMIQFLRTQGAAHPDLKPFLTSLEQVAEQIPKEYAVQKENMKSADYAAELARKTVALAGRKSPENVAAYAELSKDWRAMGGAQDYVLAQCHTIARRLFQEAGYGALRQPKALEAAQEIRRRTRLCLRNPDGYEIWPNY